MIPMRQEFEKINFLVGNEKILEEMKFSPALPIFYSRILDFFSDLSNFLLKDGRSRQSADLTAFAYWIRKNSLQREKTLREKIIPMRLGRGIVFHIAPSNVPLAFAMSFTAGLLSGNANIVRISSRDFFEVDIICDAINNLLEEKFSDLKKYFCFVRYPHDEEITKIFSKMCDVRVIWGGDNTIQTIRKIPLPPRAIELTFANRHSVALIDAEKFLNSDTDKVAKKFFDDTYRVDQNACSSPRIVIWFGEKIFDAQEKFWSAIKELAEKNYNMQAIQAVDKFSAACLLGMKNFGAKLQSVENFVVRVEVENLSENLFAEKPGGGFFIEYSAKQLEEIFPILNKNCQTLAVFGIDKKILQEKIISAGVRGVDRIVELGETNRLNLLWDGFDLICEMSRIVEVEDEKFFI